MIGAKKQRDLTSGPIFVPMLMFVIPIMLTGILQALYNMADNVVVGQFSGDPTALAAVGSTSSLTNLVLNMVMGLASGAGVMVAQSFGARDDNMLERAVHVSMTFSLIVGVISGSIGILISEPALIAMGTKPEILDKSVLYMRIICAGIPATAVYNFGATILRSVGDSKTPLYILSLSGLINVLLNLVFVIFFHMSVAGVALATIISQYVSAVAVIAILVVRSDKNYRLVLSRLRLERGMLLRILRFGVPAGIQSSLFGISNVAITSAANTFDTVVVSAKTISGNIDGLLYTALNSYMHAATTFTGQNYGAKKIGRTKSAVFCAFLQVIGIGAILSALLLVFSKELTLLYLDPSDPFKDEVLATTVEILRMLLPAYLLCGLMEMLAGSLRGLGYSFTPMFVNLIGTCGTRILWVLVFFPLEALNSITGLFLIYPISWVITSTSHIIVLIIAWRTLKKKFPSESTDTTDSESTVIETKT